MKIAILDDYQDAVRTLSCFELLNAHQVSVFNDTYPEADLISKLQDIEALVLIRERTVITENLLANLPNLKVISQTGKVSNHIDPEMCEQYGVKVLEGRGSPVAPSELCWALIMSASRHLDTYGAQLQQGNWQSSQGRGLGRTLSGLTLGIWGYGKIGRRIAQYAKAFDLSVLVWGSEGSRQQAQADGFQAAESKEAFFATADIVSLHLRLNQVTQYCVTAEDLQAMKPDALFVNISRAELVAPNALLEVMTAEPSKMAAIDVYVNEPATPANEPLLALPNVVATPHLGYVEKNSYELYFRLAFENILAFEQGAA
ncbi:D-2-hydroxyacid dehydrogenase family protein [Rhodanobacter aciditrophus]|uniref:D-2-hydroxyacid dehydrogenase family protein n=1 Tax=Rhodanobacter aciditrophus TaxID=1623218 RepID=A0ABW4AVR6_9GAMM